MASAIVLTPFSVEALTTDGSINTDEVPALSLPQAMAEAIDGLGTNAPHFVCTYAVSIKRASGGGWRFFFQNYFTTRFVEVNDKGAIIANGDDLPPSGQQFKRPPSLSIEKVVTIATASVTQAGTWTLISAVWNDEQDKWWVKFVNDQQTITTYAVDSKGDATHFTQMQIHVRTRIKKIVPPPAGYDNYVVKEGDTLSSIANQFGDQDSLDEIATRNHISNVNLIRAGQVLLIKQPRQ